jgi:hypothetical protein
VAILRASRQPSSASPALKCPCARRALWRTSARMSFPRLIRVGLLAPLAEGELDDDGAGARADVQGRGVVVPDAELGELQEDFRRRGEFDPFGEPRRDLLVLLDLDGDAEAAQGGGDPLVDERVV